MEDLEPSHTVGTQYGIRSDQSLSRVWLFATPWIAARQASLSITNSRSCVAIWCSLYEKQYGGSSKTAWEGVVKNPPAMWDTWVWSLGREDPLEEAMATHSVFWPGESHGQRSLVPCSPWGHKESDRTERLSTARDSSGGSGRGVTCLHRRPLVCWVTSRRTPLSPRQCCFWFWVYAVSEFCCLDTCYSDKTGDLSKVWAHMQIPSCLTMLQLRREESSFQWHRQAPDGGVLPLPRSRKLSLNLSLDYVPLYLPV